MRRLFDWRWAGSAAVAWLVPAVLIAVLPAEARAGCNHPWVKGGGLSSSLVDLSLLDPSDRRAVPEPRPPKPQDHPGPCAGGACSQAPELPASSTVSVSSDGELWGDLPADVLPLFPRSERVSPEPDRRYPARSLAPIERPPRPALAR
jgi:hypothetical protein